MADTPLNLTRLPRHVGIIMDGNGRWAKKNKLKVALGHNAGTLAVRAIIREASDLGIEAITLYAFSTENWHRPQPEIDALMALLLQFFTSDIGELQAQNVQVKIVGDKDSMPTPQRAALYEAERLTAANTGLTACFAVNYGGRAEIVRAAKTLAASVQAGAMEPGDITEDLFAQSLCTAGVPDVDLLIRTSGEKRLSNFLLWQCAYAEFMFPAVLWPDFTKEEFRACIAAYQTRCRRFGGRP